jgi:hypothetical protein
MYGQPLSGIYGDRGFNGLEVRQPFEGLRANLWFMECN